MVPSRVVRKHLNGDHWQASRSVWLAASYTLRSILRGQRA